MLYVLALLLGSFAASAASPAKQVPRPNLPDAQIEQNIRAGIAKSKISADHFTVRVKNGVATLEGKTDIIQRKGWATRYAKLGGARQVVNNIQVSEAARQRAREKLAAARARAKVQKTARAATAKPGPVSKPAGNIKPPVASAPATTSKTPAGAGAIKRAIIKH